MFSVLTSLDGKSRIFRKNPFGAATAFQRAFPTQDNVTLTVKCHDCPPSFERRLRDIIGNRLAFVDGYVPAEDMQALMRRAHVFLSLHRGEGFGLHLLESMAAGLPVISTAFGGSMDYQHDGNSLLVPYTLTPATDAYYGSGDWAEPDIDAAIAYLRSVYSQWPAEIVSAGLRTAAEWGSARQADALRARI